MTRDPPATSGFDADGEAAEECYPDYLDEGLDGCRHCKGQGCERCGWSGVDQGEGGS